MGIHFNPNVSNVKAGQIADINDKKLAMARNTNIGDVSADAGLDSVKISNKAAFNSYDLGMLAEMAGVPAGDKATQGRMTAFAGFVNEFPTAAGLDTACAISFYV